MCSPSILAECTPSTIAVLYHRFPEGSMRFTAAAIVAVLVIASLAAQSDSFKLGRFAQGGRTFLGVVVDDKTSPRFRRLSAPA